MSERPTYAEMEAAILAWAAEPSHVLALLREPTDQALWGLANRLRWGAPQPSVGASLCTTCHQPYTGLHFCAAVAGRERPEASVEAPSRPATVLDGKYRCCVCGEAAGVHLTTAPVCAAHDSPVAVEAALAACRALLADPAQRYGPNRAGKTWVMVDGSLWDAARAALKEQTHAR